MKKRFLLLFAAALAAALSIPALAFATDELPAADALECELETLDAGTDDGYLMFRLYNPYSGEHFYTASWDELYDVRDAGWTYEGVGWIAPEKSNTPVHRLYNKYSGDHHYTTNATEKDNLVKAGWSYEGIGWYSDDSKSYPLYRQYNPYAWSGTHNYTTAKSENDSLVKAGWNAEGIGWYAVGEGFPLSRLSQIAGWWVEVGEGQGTDVDSALNNFTTETYGAEYMQVKTDGTLVENFTKTKKVIEWTLAEFIDGAWMYDEKGNFIMYIPEWDQLFDIFTASDGTMYVTVFERK